MDEKKVENLFDNISARYDRANYFISLGLERYWRKVFLSFIDGSERKALDACCGTGFSTFSIAGKLKGQDASITGVDFSNEMLEAAKKSLSVIKKRSSSKNFVKINFARMDATDLEFSNESFDLTTVVFGIRNVKDRLKALEEFYRTSQENAKLLIMEFNFPKNRFFSPIYSLYLKHIMPFIGGLITGNKGAYKYLFETIKAFPSQEEFAELINESGWKIIEIKSLSFKTCSIYFAQK